MAANFPLPSFKKSAGGGWLIGCAVLVALLLAMLAMMFLPSQSATEKATESGRRVTIALETGEISGKLAPKKALPPSELPKGEGSGAVTPTIAPTIAPTIEPTVAETPAPAIAAGEGEGAAAEEKFEPTSPAARMEPRDNPEIQAAEIPAPATESAEAPVVKIEPSPSATNEKPLAAPHQPGLGEVTPEGNILPVIGKDGSKPWMVYGRPFADKSKKPKIAIIITGLGLTKYVTEAAISLPGALTLTFSPYARETPTWAETARRSGHEVLIDLPLEPLDYPATDPGPRSLLARNPDDENRKRLLWSLGRFSGYVGVYLPKAEKLSNNLGALKMLITEVDQRGLMVIAANAMGKPDVLATLKTPNLAAVVPDVVVDQDVSAAGIEMKLAELEKIAKQKGFAIGICHPYPITLKHLTGWSDGLAAKGFVLAPASAIAAQHPLK